MYQISFLIFFFSELLLYKPFCDIQVDIGDDNITIVSNWESLYYVPWHVERRVDVQSSDGSFESGSDNNVMGPPNIIEHEWEIISWMHHGQLMEIFEVDMLGRRDMDRQHSWSEQYKSNEYTLDAINFIGRMRESGYRPHLQCEQEINSSKLGEKQKMAFDVIVRHYNGGDTVTPLYMIIQGTAGT